MAVAEGEPLRERHGAEVAGGLARGAREHGDLLGRARDEARERLLSRDPAEDPLGPALLVDERLEVTLLGGREQGERPHVLARDDEEGSAGKLPRKSRHGRMVSRGPVFDRSRQHV